MLALVLTLEPQPIPQFSKSNDFPCTIFSATYLQPFHSHPRMFYILSLPSFLRIFITTTRFWISTSIPFVHLNFNFYLSWILLILWILLIPLLHLLLSSSKSSTCFPCSTVFLLISPFHCYPHVPPESTKLYAFSSSPMTLPLFCSICIAKRGTQSKPLHKIHSNEFCAKLHSWQLPGPMTAACTLFSTILLLPLLSFRTSFLLITIFQMW